MDVLRGPTARHCLAVIDEFEFEYSIDVAGAADDPKVKAFVADRSQAEQEAWTQLVAWAKVRVEVRLSQVAENARDGAFWRTIATAEPACNPRQVTARGKAEGRAQPNAPPHQSPGKGQELQRGSKSAGRQPPSGS